MSITDELRKVASKTECANGRCEKLYRGDLERIADRIDAQHERAMADAYLSGTPTDEKLTELGWIRLPKDADGEYIHVGDVMENIVCPPVHREVTGVGVECFYGWDDGNGRYSQFGANCYRHYHAPTVEDVLAEFSVRVLNSGHQWGLDGTEVIAEYAARLRLTEGEDA